MRISNDELTFDSTDLSGSAVSEAYWLGHVANYSISLLFTGAPVGEFKLQCSNDLGSSASNKEALRSAEVVNWSDVKDSTQAIAEAGDHTWTVRDAGYRWVRVVWTPTSGTGTLTVARINTKGI